MDGYKVYPEIGSSYRHYKGGTYSVITMCTHSETGEVLVIYRSELFGTVYARPLDMWFEDVMLEGDDEIKKRFVKI